MNDMMGKEETIKCSTIGYGENLPRDVSKKNPGGLRPEMPSLTSQHECIQGINANNEIKEATAPEISSPTGRISLQVV
jgi:hypothetical protein